MVRPAITGSVEHHFSRAYFSRQIQSSGIDITYGDPRTHSVGDLCCELSDTALPDNQDAFTHTRVRIATRTHSYTCHAKQRCMFRVYLCRQFD